MPKRLLFDTDVLIDYLRGVQEAIAYLESRKEVLLVSAVTAAELYAGVREGQERTALGAFIGAFEVLPLDQAIAEKGGLLRRDYGKSHGTGLADALIAATAELQRATLVTRNHKHFPMLKHVQVPYHC
ncbi:MAG: type II toxin-antitoxin system VapC family toxin [Nitrococcus sp.]|nr:type II toxin-antitoxin system VapC family toxin [Nitrococcus sp.]